MCLLYTHWRQRKIALLLPVSEASKQASNKRKPTDCTRDGKQLGTKQSGYRRLGSCRGISLLRSGDESLETPMGVRGAVGASRRVEAMWMLFVLTWTGGFGWVLGAEEDVCEQSKLFYGLF